MKIKSRFDHFNFNVLDLNKSIDFYNKALGLKEKKRKQSEDGSFILVFLGDDYSNFSLELTWLKNRTEKYDLGQNEFHLCMRVENYEETFEYHKKNGWVCFENKEMGLYFINDPDGYWIEILKVK